MADKVWTSAEALTWTVSRFTGAAVDSPRLDAELLLAAALDCERVDLYTTPERPLETQERARYRALIERRLAGEPVAYILGRKSFRYLTLKVTPAVLVPRPETELLVEVVLEFARGEAADLEKPRSGPAVADIGTGSGAVAISLAKEIEGSRVWATDVSSEALAVAKENAEDAGLLDLIEFLEGDLLAPLPPEVVGELDAIASNPPYIPTGEIGSLPPEISRYEPRAALDGGADGTDVLRKIAAAAPRCLRAGGLLALEIGESQADVVCNTMSAEFDNVSVRKDLAGLDRIVLGTKKMGQ